MLKVEDIRRLNDVSFTPAAAAFLEAKGLLLQEATDKVLASLDRVLWEYTEEGQEPAIVEIMGQDIVTVVDKGWTIPEDWIGEGKLTHMA